MVVDDPLQSNDPWARFQCMQLQGASVAVPATPPKPDAPAPPIKVQAVVEPRVLDAETRLTAQMDGISQTLRQAFSQQVEAIRSECAPAAASTELQSIRQAFNQECEALRSARTQMQQQLNETVTHVQQLESGFVEQVKELKQQQAAMEARLLEAITSASAKDSPARKTARS